MDYQAQESAQAAPAQQYAGVGSRFLALLIDGIIVGIVIGILDAVFGLAIKNTGPAIGSGIGGIIALVYYFYMEATQGGTFGKKILGLRIVKEDGSPIGWSESIIRNLLRIIDGLFAYLIGAILIWTSPRKQRLGDRAAHTVVIKTR
ncbi:hypothetical protein KSD_66000 [Ktedonobacter sp. SOSP1-85]|uniref:RDD family protein n=1 Tax=Ktedonobacter sp. SOSP1-85 TaxID=2778367 RepID=UPI0019156220|nr:RDD family protein [Ktedonobacter sp. SOSP1-85]GHO78829.1 hypothetical protein KSD_66000 [Ktedonobacter sp. SOSP1-85]